MSLFRNQWRLPKDNQEQKITTEQGENNSSLNLPETLIKCIKCGFSDCNGNCKSKTKSHSCANDNKCKY